MPSFSATNTTFLHLRDELEAAEAANNHYNPFKIILAVVGIHCLAMLLIVIGCYARSRHERKKAMKEQGAKDSAMVELFGGSQHVKRRKEDEFVDVNLEAEERRKKGVTRWSFARHFGK
jgi:hypothetical protein